MGFGAVAPCRGEPGANRLGGQPSVSALITELVERHREELEQERD
jgi:hypothetical protein